jgi:DNA polymerase-1
MARRIALFDGNWYLWRSFHAIATPMLKKDLNAKWQGLVVHQMIGMVCKDALKLQAKQLCIFLDGPNGYRYEIYPEYKAGRSAKDSGDSNAEEVSVYDCLPSLFNVLDHIGIPYQQVEGYEADDLFASFKYLYEPLSTDRVYICTRDKDMSQLIDGTYRVFTPGSKKRPDIFISLENVAEYRYGLSPARYLDYQTLIGDGIDNIPAILKPAKALKLVSSSTFKNIKHWMTTEEGQQFVKDKGPELVRNRMLVKLSKTAFEEVPNITPKFPKKEPDFKVPTAYLSYRSFASSKTKTLF